MKAIESGSIRSPGLSKKEAKEMTEGQSPKNLPEKKASGRYKKLFKK
jgi:hypothetical protein